MADDKRSWEELAHAMQSGVAAEMQAGLAGTDPKHLRVGLNTALSDQAGLVRLLIKKGLFTQEEYVKAITEEMAREVQRHEALLKAHYGKDIKLY